MSEDILKDDPLKSPKKALFAGVILGMAVLMVCTFASFHWICTDYFAFKATENEARKQLDGIRARCEQEESAAQKRLAEIESKSRASETDAIQRVKTSEEDARKRIQEAEQSAKSRIEELEKEYQDRRVAKIVEHQNLMTELDESFKARKNDIAVLLRGFKERFDAKTNDFELAIVSKNAELSEIKRMISMLPNVKKELEDANNALASVREQRDAALKEERTVQESYGKWSAKVESARVQLDELNGRRDALENELSVVAQNTNDIRLAMTSLQGQVKKLQAKIAVAKTELQTVQDDVELAKSELKGVQGQIAVAEKNRKTAEIARAEAESALSVALDKKREAESARDKVQSEMEYAEMHWKKRKPEIDGLIKDMERILEMKSQAVKVADDKNKGDANE